VTHLLVLVIGVWIGLALAAVVQAID